MGLTEWMTPVKDQFSKVKSDDENRLIFVYFMVGNGVSGSDGIDMLPKIATEMQNLLRLLDPVT